jgi:hypothetical protein
MTSSPSVAIIIGNSISVIAFLEQADAFGQAAFASTGQASQPRRWIAIWSPIVFGY